MMVRSASEEAFRRDGVEPLLHGAVARGDVQRAAVLLEAGHKVDCLNAQRETPLHSAVEHQNEAMVRLLLHHGADPSVPPPYGVGVLYEVVETGNLALISLFLNNPQCLAELQLPDYHNPLVAAVVRESVDITHLLLRHGARTDVASQRGETPLFMVAMATDEEKQLQLAILLLKYGADGCSKDKHGHSPTHYSWHNAFSAYLTEYCTRNEVRFLKSLARRVILEQLVSSQPVGASCTVSTLVSLLHLPLALHSYMLFSGH